MRVIAMFESPRRDVTVLDTEISLFGKKIYCIITKDCRTQEELVRFGNVTQIMSIIYSLMKYKPLPDWCAEMKEED